MFVINRVCRLILNRKGMEVNVSPAARLAKPTVKESSMRVKKRVKRGVKKGIKRVKSAPPEAYLAGVGVLVGGAAVVLLATTKSGQELLSRTAQLALRPEADEQESQESDVQEDAHMNLNHLKQTGHDTSGDDESEVADLKPRNQRPRSQGKAPAPRKAAEEADVEEEEDTNGDDESEVADLKPRNQRPRSQGKAPVPRKATSA